MSRKLLIPLMAAAILAMPAFAPATMTSLSGSALAQKTTTPTTDATNLNSSRSNVNRTNDPATTPNLSPTTGGATGKNGSTRTTTVKSSKSNTSDRTTTVKSSKSNTSDRTTTVKGSKSNTSDRN